MNGWNKWHTTIHFKVALTHRGLFLCMFSNLLFAHTPELLISGLRASFFQRVFVFTSAKPLMLPTQKY